MACCKDQCKVPDEYYEEIDHPSGGDLRTSGNSFNLGLSSGRMATYPLDYVCFTQEDAEEMVRSGLVWRGIADHSEVACDICRVTFSWRPGMNVDEEHRRRAPNCPWMGRHDRGLDMELHINWKMPRTLLMKYHDDGHKDIICLKCDVIIPYVKVPHQRGQNPFGAFDREAYMMLHHLYSPECTTCISE
jgi:hypothetical protein